MNAGLVEETLKPYHMQKNLLNFLHLQVAGSHLVKLSLTFCGAVTAVNQHVASRNHRLLFHPQVDVDHVVDFVLGLNSVWACYVSFLREIQTKPLKSPRHPFLPKSLLR